MDRETAKELIALIDAKIARLQQSKREIQQLADKEIQQLDAFVTEPQVSYPMNGASETTKQVYEALLATGKTLSPKELFSELKERGIDLPDTRVRQVLMRWKGRLFKSPERGQWKAIKQKQ